MGGGGWGSQEHGPLANKKINNNNNDKTETATSVEEQEKRQEVAGIQFTAPRFRTGRGYPTSLAFL